MNNNISRKIAYFAYFPLSVLWFELMLKLWTGETPFRLFTVFLFAVSSGAVFPIIGTLTRKRKVNTILSVASLSALAVAFAAEMIIKKTFSVFMGVSVVTGNAGNATGQFGGEVFSAIVSALFGIVTLAIPPVALWFTLKFKVIQSAPFNIRLDACFVAIAIVFNILGYGAVHIGSGAGVQDKDIYSAYYDFNEAVPRFGLSKALGLDVKYAIFGVPEADIDIGGDMPGGIPTVSNGSTSRTLPWTSDEPDDNINAPVTTDENGQTNATDSPVIAKTGPNIIERYDFAAMAATESDKTVKQMDEYFAAATPTDKNKYTGLFEGKNLILISAEAFHTFVMSEELTPTLWKMAHNGIVLNEYYQPAWGGGTSTGEYSNIFGLMPNGADSMKDTIKQDVSYTIGNQLTDRGYYTLAFHDGTSTYYDRDKTHKRLGYSDWITINTGMYDNFSAWSYYSDEQMMRATLPMYIDKEPFHAYYMSYSGHYPYKTDNAYAKRDWSKVKNLPYSDELKAYMAMNFQLEYGLAYMVETLEAAGKLDDTVFVISPDHYPYGLDTDDNRLLKELIGQKYLDGSYYKNFDVMRTTGIIYCSSIKEPIVVDAPSYSLDLAPTIMNLFGIEYDSRLFTGRDLLSDAPALVMFTNYDWITDVGYYKANSKKFIPRNGATVSNDYVDQMNSYVKTKVLMGRYIQKYNYYAKLPKATV